MSNTTTQPSPSPTAGSSFFASEVAGAFADAINASDVERSEIFDVAIDIGTQLATRGNPGRWHLFDPADMFRCLTHLPASTRGEIAVRAMLMFHFLAEREAISPGRVIRISKKIFRASPARRGHLRELHDGFVERCRIGPRR